jgi:hypothetical protein
MAWRFALVAAIVTWPASPCPSTETGRPGPVPQAPVKKVLIIGIDGCRPDALKAAKAPHLHALMREGAFSEAAQAGDITVSGPGWSSMLTGVWRTKHGVRDNKFEVHRFHQPVGAHRRAHRPRRRPVHGAEERGRGDGPGGQAADQRRAGCALSAL